jgi:hypothetical protein
MTTHTELLPRYKHLRQVGRKLNTRLVETLSRSVMNEGGRRLGILEGDALLLDTEDEIAVLMDYCIHDVRRHGINTVEEFLRSSPPPAESDEWILLQALRQCRFSVFVVESSESGVGVYVRDLLRDESLFLVDVGLSQSAPVGMILAARLMAPEGIGMTTGAALPVDTLSPAERAGFVEELRDAFKGVDFRNLSPEEASDFAGTVIRTCLAEGAAEGIAYVELSGEKRRGRKKRSSPTKKPKRK